MSCIMQTSNKRSTYSSLEQIKVVYYKIHAEFHEYGFRERNSQNSNVTQILQMTKKGQLLVINDDKKTMMGQET